MNAGVGPLSSDRLNTHAVRAATMIPIAYSDSMIPACAKGPYVAKNAPISNVYTGRRALQLMNGAMRIVASRSFRLSIVRVAIMPGMAQAKELSSGMKLLPCSPTRDSKPVHQERRPRQVAAILQYRQEQEQQRDLRHEDHHRADAGENAVRHPAP